MLWSLRFAPSLTRTKRFKETRKTSKSRDSFIEDSTVASKANRAQ